MASSIVCNVPSELVECNLGENSRKNILYARFLFYNRKQRDGESFNNFLTEIKKLCQNCKFTKKDELLRDKVVLGTNDIETQEKLIKMGDLSLKDAIEHLRSAEINKVQTKPIKSEKEPIVDAIKCKKEHTFQEERPNGKNTTLGEEEEQYSSDSQYKQESMAETNSCPTVGRECLRDIKKESIDEWQDEPDDLPTLVNYNLDNVKNEQFILRDIKEEINEDWINETNGLSSQYNISTVNHNVNIVLNENNLDLTGVPIRYRRTNKCKVCHKTFNSTSSLNVHARIHRGEKPFKCKVCQQTFTQNSNLIVHAKKHTGDRPFECNICHKTFGRSCYLKVHTRIHKGEKPYTCKICQQTFTQNSGLYAHSRTHSGVKPYMCDVCQMAFSHKSTLIFHVRTHIPTEEKPLICNECLKTFRNKSSIRQHILRIHNG